MENDNLLQRFKKSEPFIHLVLWCMVLFYPYIKYIGGEGGYSLSFLHELNSLFFKMTISYFLYFWFFPKKNKKKHILFVIIALVLNALLYEFFDRFFHIDHHHFWKHFTANILTYSSFGMVFFAIYSIKSLYKKQAEIDQLAQEKKLTELSALKAQVNPHFLFNTLNTIYANALKKDDKTPELILKLSDGFRYMLHEGQKEQVYIGQEVQHLNDYINLQQERLLNKVLVRFSTNIDHKKTLISPLLFITFVENAFKYTSMLKGDKHLINIKLQLQNNELFFTCKNPYNEQAQQEIDTDWKESGVGIKNTKKRLALLYPDQYQLIIKKENNTFKVTLKVIL